MGRIAPTWWAKVLSILDEHAELVDLNTDTVIDFRHSHDSLYQPRADNLAMLKRGMETQPKTRFKDRRVRVFEGGFVQQHTIFVTYENGFVGQMDVCFVGYVRDGMISRAYEYFDTGQIEKFVGPRN